MNIRRAPLLMTATSGLLASAVAVTPMVLTSRTTLEAVPAPQQTTDTQAPDSAALAQRTDEVTRDLTRPELSQIASNRVLAQSKVFAAISANDSQLSAQQKKAQEDAKKAADAAAAKAAAAKAAAAQAAAAAPAAAAVTTSAGGAYSGSPRDIGRQIAASEFGWGAAQFQCYDNIIMHESAWNPTATNPGSGAYGIPQSLPGDKMASAGADWRTNPATQIRWGLGYVKDRYGTPCAAWSFKSANGWY